MYVIMQFFLRIIVIKAKWLILFDRQYCHLQLEDGKLFDKVFIITQHAFLQLFYQL